MKWTAQLTILLGVEEWNVSLGWVRIRKAKIKII